MNSNLVIGTIGQLSNEIKNIKIIKEKKRDKYIKDLENVKSKYTSIEIDENYKKQYNQLNTKGVELLKDIRNKKIKEKNSLEQNIEVYIRYLKASTYDFEGNTKYIRQYITSFLFSSILFLALSPQFYGFILPVLFFMPIYLGLKGVKKRSIAGFYMTMSLVPVALMTSFTWIRYGMHAFSDYTGAVDAIVKSGVSEGLAQNLVYIGPAFGTILLFVACLQLYRGYKTKDLFI